MTTECGTIITKAGVTLQDVDAVRWPFPELLGYLNDGVREITARKPNAETKTIALPLALGAVQSLPPEYTVLSHVSRNLTVVGDALDPTTFVGGAKIEVMRDTSFLDAMIPGWMDTAVMPFSATVRHLIYDLINPRVFTVAPGNTGAGNIEVIVGVNPANIPVPVTDNDISEYTQNVGLPDLYMNMLLDYVLYRAFSKDAGLPGSSPRAVAHKALFDEGLGAMAGGESAAALPK